MNEYETVTNICQQNAELLAKLHKALEQAERLLAELRKKG